jgi:transcriptional regulator with XRE-family HTH domain
MKRELSPVALQELRKLKGLSHHKLAEQAHLAKSTIIELEKPPRKPSTTMHSVQDRSFDALKRVLGATDAQMRGEEPINDPVSVKFVPLRSKITTVAQMNYDLVGEQYGVSSDQLVQLAPLMFAILVEDSFAWRKEQLELRKQIEELKKQTRDSQYDPEPDLHDGVIDEDFLAEDAALAAREVFSKPSLAELPDGYGHASDRFTDFVSAKVKSSGGHIRADLTFGYLDRRDILDPDTKYLAVPELFDATTAVGDQQIVARLRLWLMSGAMRLADLRADRTPEQLAEWLRSEVIPKADALEPAIAPEVYRFDTEAEGLGLDAMGFPVRVRRHELARATPQSDDQGDENAPA